MNNQELLSQSGECLSFFQLFDREKLNVEIPVIQRDYAQGRDKQRSVREAFLEALYGYLDESKPFQNLDFVYGSIVEDERNNQNEGGLGRFVPLDGQQRLTTLFLLHWYLSQTSGQAELLRSALTLNSRSRFTYETRSSSREFCDALMQCDLDLNLLVHDNNSGLSVSEYIRDRSWFYLSWASDPTIQSMLNMLDSIHEKFVDRPEFFDRLVSEDEPIITFLFLNLQEFKLTDDLYIKMNARGKPLTDFENFKARLEKRLAPLKVCGQSIHCFIRTRLSPGMNILFIKSTPFGPMYFGGIVTKLQRTIPTTMS